MVVVKPVMMHIFGFKIVLRRTMKGMALFVDMHNELGQCKSVYLLNCQCLLHGNYFCRQRPVLIRVAGFLAVMKEANYSTTITQSPILPPLGASLPDSTFLP